MRQRIVLIGESPLVLFLAEALDKSVANLVQTDVVWLTTEAAIICLSHQQSMSAHQKVINKKSHLNHVRLINNRVNSINLVERRLITDRGTLTYDYLFIDQASSYRPGELKTITDQLKKLTAAIKAAVNTGDKPAAEIFCKGQSAESYQLALNIRAELVHEQVARQVSVMCEGDRPDDLKKFLTAAGLKVGRRRLEKPGLTIQAPAILDLRKIRGLKIDAQYQAMTGSTAQVLGHPEVMILNSRPRFRQNLLRFQKTLGQRLAKSLINIVESREPLTVELEQSALLLTHGEESFVWLGKLMSRRTRGRIIRQLDRRLHSKLR